MNIYLVRHGETIANNKALYCGVADVELTQLGKKQTENTAAYLKNINASVYSSPLARARILADMICDDVVCDNRLCERDFGIWEQLSYEQICNNYPNEADKWNSDWVNYVIPNGESCVDVDARCKEFLKEVLENNRDCIIVTHSGIIRNIITILLNMKIEDVWRFKIDNGSVTHIEISDGYSVINSLNYIP